MSIDFTDVSQSACASALGTWRQALHFGLGVGHQAGSKLSRHSVTGTEDSVESEEPLSNLSRFWSEGPANELAMQFCCSFFGVG